MESASAETGERLTLGDPAAFEDAYRTLRPTVQRYLRRIVPAADVEDVTQRVFSEVWRVHDRYDPDRSLQGWVFGIARKRAIDQLRRRRAVVAPLDVMREIAGEDGRETADRVAWAQELQRALTKLPQPQQQAIELAYFAGYTQAEIAAMLDVPLGTVKTRTRRGLHRLACLLENARWAT